jgi:DNA polymerase III delta subunit
MVVVLTGKNSYLLQKNLQDTTQLFTDEFGDSVERFDGSELTSADGVLDAVRSISFLEPRKLVIVRDFAQCKDLIEKIESVISQTADSTDLLLVDPKLDKRTSAYTFIKKNSELRTFDDIAPYELQRWLVDESKSIGLELPGDLAKFLVDRVGPNQQLLSSELEKLSLQTAPVTKTIIEELVEPTPQSKVFDMLEALFTGKPQRAQELYLDQRAQGEEPQKLLAMITWQLQQLTLAVFAPSKSVDKLVSAGMSPYSAQKALQMAKHITPTDLKFYITELAEIDASAKTNADIESALSVYFSEITTR